MSSGLCYCFEADSYKLFNKMLSKVSRIYFWQLLSLKKKQNPKPCLGQRDSAFL